VNGEFPFHGTENFSTGRLPRRKQTNFIFSLTHCTRRALSAARFGQNANDANEATVSGASGSSNVLPFDAAVHLKTLAGAMVALPPAERIAHLREHLDGRIVFTHGFGVEGQLIFNWICDRDLAIDVVTLDTGRLYPETYALWAQTERRYGRRINAIYPDRGALERLVNKQGINGFYESKAARMACCDVRKNRPLDRALNNAKAWITGLRADQTAVRRDAGLIGFDASRGLIKFNPLVDWTREQVMAAVRANNIPVNPLHEKGFASIGCAPCTRAIKPGEPERNGRWWWEQEGARECGLHLPRKGATRDDPRRDHVEISGGCG
jgi:phosphoadenosine phosphosulfate reductase